MGIDQIRKLHDDAGEPKRKKNYRIPKVSPKRQAAIAQNKLVAAIDHDFYEEIWRTRLHFCENCRARLGDQMKKWFMHHLLSKGKYPQFRYVPACIMLLCLQCHSKAETDISFAPEIKRRKDEAEKLLLP